MSTTVKTRAATARRLVRRPRGRPRDDVLRANTRRRILDAARDEFAAQGFHATSVDDIVRASGLSKGGFYFHFRSKDAVFEALYDELSGALYDRAASAALTETDPLEKLAAGVRAFIRGCYELKAAKLIFADGAWLNPLLGEKREAAMTRFAELIRTEMDAARERGLIPPVNTRILARALVGAFAELGTEVVRSRDPEAVEEVADVLVDVICYMALTEVMSKR